MMFLLMVLLLISGVVFEIEKCQAKALCKKKRQEVTSPSNSVHLADTCVNGNPGCLCKENSTCNAGLICR
jgi:hypothetical protein